jgi:hypothetical protein
MDHFAGLNVSVKYTGVCVVVRYDGHPWVPRRQYNDVGRNLGPFTRVFGHSQT